MGEKQIDNLVEAKRTPVGEKAEQLVAIKEEIEKLKSKYGTVEQELLILMHKTNQSRVQIGGLTIRPKIIASKEKIEIKKDVK